MCVCVCLLEFVYLLAWQNKKVGGFSQRGETITVGTVWVVDCFVVTVAFSW